VPPKGSEDDGEYDKNSAILQLYAGGGGGSARDLGTCKVGQGAKLKRVLLPALALRSQ
jgi:hypothetical protein